MLLLLSWQRISQGSRLGAFCVLHASPPRAAQFGPKLGTAGGAPLVWGWAHGTDGTCSGTSGSLTVTGFSVLQIPPGSDSVADSGSGRGRAGVTRV